MATVSETLNQILEKLSVGQVTEWISQILKIGSGGPVYWIATAVISLVVASIIYFLRRKIKEWIYNDSLKEIGKVAEEQKKAEQDVSNNLEEARKETEKIVEQNPDDEKISRPNPAQTIED